MKEIFHKAIKYSEKVRSRLHFDPFEPVNIYDICIEIGITVRIVNINMEGMYIQSDKKNGATILLSNERPLPRRVFTCTHEFGHHVFGHGSKIDVLNHSAEYTRDQDIEELLVNAFAGYLLMPIAGVMSEFNKKKCSSNTASALDYYAISSYFGVGYNTLIYHCRYNNLIEHSKLKELLKFSPAKLFKKHFSMNLESSHYRYFDSLNFPLLIDLAVSNYLIIPNDLQVDGDFLEELETTSLGTIYRAIASGTSDVNSKISGILTTVRIEQLKFSGLANYRHLE